MLRNVVSPLKHLEIKDVWRLDSSTEIASVYLYVLCFFKNRKNIMQSTIRSILDDEDILHAYASAATLLPMDFYSVMWLITADS